MVTLTKFLKEKIMKKKILLPFLCIGNYACHGSTHHWKNYQ